MISSRADEKLPGFIRGREWMVVVLMAAGLVVMKIPYLSLPTYWDESSPYSEAIQYQLDHGAGFLPSSMPPDLSRGHPLLYHTLQTTWIKVFGHTPLTSRLYPMLLSVLIIFVVYFFSARHLSKTAGMVAVLWLLLDHTFNVQSVFMLPETQVGLFLMLSLAAWVGRKWGWYLLWCSALLLTKETSMVIPMALFTAVFAEVIILRKRKISEQIKTAAFSLAPLAVLAGFFIIQKMQYGWFIFPLHTETSSLSPGDILYNFVNFHASRIAIEDGRGLMSLLALAGFIYLFLRHKEIFRSRLRIIGAGVFCILALTLLLSTSEFKINRYVLCLYPVFYLITAWLITEAVSNWKIWIPVTLVLCILPFRTTFFMKTAGDTTLGYADRVRIHQESIDWFKSQGLKDKKIYGEFVWNRAATQPSCLYVKRGEELTQVHNNPEIKYDFVTENDCEVLNPGMQPRKGKLVKEFVNGEAFLRIYEYQDSVAVVQP